MTRGFRWAVAVVGASSLLALSACGDDEPDPKPIPTPSPSASPSASPATETIDLVCDPPVGAVTVTIRDPEDQWAPGYVKGSNTVLWPVSFGEITFTDSATGETHVEAAVDKPGTDATGAIGCTWDETVDDVDESGTPVHGTVTGSVRVLVK